MKKITLLFLALTGMLNVANAQVTLYTENFSSNFGYTGDVTTVFKPSDKYGTWSGGKDLTTVGDVNAGIRYGWSSTNLSFNSTQPAVTIAGIPVAGYSGLSLSYVNVMTTTPVAPFIEASTDNGITWTTLPTVATGGSYSRETKVVALPAGTYSTISLRINPPAAGVGDQILDDFKITGTVSLGIGSNELTENSIKVYPNPFTSEFKVDATNSEGPLQVSVFDVLGRKIATAKSSSNQLSMGSSLKSGAYIVKVEGANAKDSKSFKIIKK